MSGSGYRYSLELLREDGTRVGEAPVRVDFEPARQWAFLAGLRENRLRPTASCANAAIVPLWHPEAGEPYVRGFEIRIVDDAGGAAVEFSTEYFRSLANRASAILAERGKLEVGEKFLYVAAAFPEPVADPHSGFTAEEIVPPLALGERALREFREASHPTGPGLDSELPVFVPETVLEEARALTRAAAGEETGGILIGNLHRDPNEPEVFMEVTAQIPARFVKSDSESLTFTAETWTDIQGVLHLRKSDEIMLGWWHSHPVREWCRKCPPERQRECRLARDFLSEHDRHLHRTVFPRAYSVALVMNDVAFDDVTYSLFGWNAGRIEARGFHVLRSPPQGTAPTAAPDPAQGEEDGTKRTAHE